MRPFETVTDLDAGSDVLRRRRYGVIEAANGRFRQVVLRPWPKLVSLPEILLWGRWCHRRRSADRMLLYYNQPGRMPNFLAIAYVISSNGASYRTCRRALETLDEIARIKRIDAMVCDVSNWRLSRRAMARWGWEQHCPSRWHRHYIKRFYGDYPQQPTWRLAPG